MASISPENASMNRAEEARGRSGRRRSRHHPVCHLLGGCLQFPVQREADIHARDRAVISRRRGGLQARFQGLGQRPNERCQMRDQVPTTGALGPVARGDQLGPARSFHQVGKDGIVLNELYPVVTPQADHPSGRKRKTVQADPRGRSDIAPVRKHGVGSYKERLRGDFGLPRAFEAKERSSRLGPAFARSDPLARCHILSL